MFTKMRTVDGLPRGLTSPWGDVYETDELGVVEVPSDLAGRPPKGDPGDADFDPGEGYLAQVDVWEPGGRTKPTKARQALKRDVTAPEGAEAGTAGEEA